MKRFLWLAMILFLVIVSPLTALAESDEQVLPETTGTETPTPALTPSPVLASQTPNPSALSRLLEAATSSSAGYLIIDSDNLYPGMDKTYAQGYVPSIADGKVAIVLPLRGVTYGNEVNLTVDLGAPDDSPFQYGNYSQAVKGVADVYLFTLEIPLSADRYNGLYPILLTAEYQNADGDRTEQKFTVYVTISDGRTTATEAPQDTSVSSNYVPSADAPNLFIEQCVISPTEVGGDAMFTVSVVVKNIGNKTARASTLIFGCEETDITSVDANSAILLGSINSGKSVEAEFQMKTDREALAGNRTFYITLNYSARTGGTYSTSREFMITVQQPSKMAYDPVSLPKEIAAGETVTLPANIFNTGRSVLRNVTVSLEGAGLFPTSSVFLGDIASGEGKSEEMKMFIGMLSMTEGYSESYGDTIGVYTISYQDSAGESYSESMEVKTKIKAPLISASPTPDPALQRAQSQWWITALVGFAIIAIVVSMVVISRFAREMRMR